jgi:AraC-like DNA-binding protein
MQWIRRGVQSSGRLGRTPGGSRDRGPLRTSELGRAPNTGPEGGIPRRGFRHRSRRAVPVLSPNPREPRLDGLDGGVVKGPGERVSVPKADVTQPVSKGQALEHPYGRSPAPELVRQDLGAAAAKDVARRMVIPPHRDGGQAQYLRWPMPPHPDHDLAPAMQWVQTNLDRHITVEDLSRHAHLSRRTLIRRFHDALGITPQQWLLRQRLLLAQDLLETSSLPVERVAERSGMGSAANLRHHFSEHLGVSPLAYRRTFGQPL